MERLLQQTIPGVEGDEAIIMPDGQARRLTRSGLVKLPFHYGDGFPVLIEVDEFDVLDGRLQPIEGEVVVDKKEG